MNLPPEMGGEEEVVAEQEGTFFLPPTYPGLDALAEGDSINLTVTRRTPEGVEVAVKAAEEAEEETFEDEARRTVTNQGY